MSISHEITTAKPPTGAGSVLPVQGMGDLRSAGELLAQASFLGCRNAGEGFVLMATCQQSGLSLIEFQQRYHFRQGRFSIQAHALLAEFVERGGSYKVVERSPTRAAIEFTKDGNKYLSEITWDQAAEEPFVYAGSEDAALAELAKPVGKRRLKNKYATPRSRMQMLWARAVSDGVVVVDPGARGGMYTPEETDDFAPALPPASAEPTPLPAAAQRAALGPAHEPAAEPFSRAQEPGENKPAARESNRAATAPAKSTAAPASKPSPKPDYSTCPIEGPMFGKPWAEMSNDHLSFALEYAVECPAITAGHRGAIEAIIDDRKYGRATEPAEEPATATAPEEK